MLPVLLLAGAAGMYWHHNRRRAHKPLAPAAVQAHGQLMGREFNPQKLELAAQKFAQNGLHAQAKDLQGKAAQIRKQTQVCVTLCKAARAGDQNAMGMIAAIREQAKTGNPRSLVSCKIIESYCLRNPPRPLGPLGETPMDNAA